MKGREKSGGSINKHGYARLKVFIWYDSREHLNFENLEADTCPFSVEMFFLVAAKIVGIEWSSAYLVSIVYFSVVLLRTR